MTRFLCVGDLHLGAGGEYGREPGDRLRDQERVWAQALELAVDHDADAVLFAGDAFHRRRPTPAELMVFQRPLQRFTAEHDIEVLAINGNHDVEAGDLPSALELFGRDLDVRVAPGIWHAPGGTSVACLPWAPVSRLVAARNGGDRDDLHREAAGLLLATARGLRAEIPSGQPAVLLLHWSISGAATPTGVMTDEFREVVLELADLEQLGFDAVVAGHIHLPDVLNGPFDGGRPVFYVGSPLPVDFGEGASQHGVWILDLDGGELDGGMPDAPTPGSPPSSRATFLPIASRPFVTLDLPPEDAAGLASGLFTWDGVADAVVRVRYTATEDEARRIAHGEISKALYEQGAHKVYAIQPTIERADRVRVAGVDEELAPLSALDLWIEAEGLDGWQRDSLRELGARYIEAVGA